VTRLSLLFGCLVLLFASGCGDGKQPGPPVGIDEQTVQDYQAQSDGDAYKDYVEPR
jgi:hypothetical protein